MTHVLVTGGTGTLGRELVNLLRQNGHTVRIMSRRPQPASLPSNTEWVQAYLATGQGIAEAVRDVQVIFHAASASIRRGGRQVDVDGTRLMLQAAKQANVEHIINISIVGIERIPFSYYQTKLAAEKVVAESGVPWSNLRATQFHNFIDLLFTAASRLPLIMPLPTDFVSQPVEVTEVAARMVRIMDEGPSGQLPDLGGPEVLRFGDMAQSWLRARHMNRLVVRMPLWGKVAEGFRKGYHTNMQGDKGTVRWSEWLERTYTKGERANERLFQS